MWCLAPKYDGYNLRAGEIVWSTRIGAIESYDRRSSFSLLYISTTVLLSYSDQFNDWGGGGHNFVPVLGGESTKIASLGDLFDQPPNEMS